MNWQWKIDIIEGLTNKVECVRLNKKGLMHSTFARYKIV